MERLLDDIQAYSRAGRVAYPAETIALGELVDELIQTIDAPTGFDLRIERPLPTVTSPRTPLEQVLLNLIGNAVKHHDRADGAVTVSAKDDPVLVELSVSDDGPGIPPELRERAFQMFETLKPRDQVEGSGIGLAVVRKLVQTLGGRIWIDDEAQGRGTTFRFTWPKQAGEPA